MRYGWPIITIIIVAVVQNTIFFASFHHVSNIKCLQGQVKLIAKSVGLILNPNAA